MRLPDFLVIGAMKAGTTTLCADLGAHPRIFIPVVKEPHTLMMDEVLTPRGRRGYADLFRQAAPHQLCGEGSTGYTKYPWSKAAPARALALMGPGLKLIYIMRDPVERARSHHYHMYRGGLAPARFSTAMEEDRSLLRCSLYGMQLAAWREVFPAENFHLMTFEQFISQREDALRGVLAFLGVEEPPPTIDPGRRLNAGDEAMYPPALVKGIKQKIARGQFYKRSLAPLVPTWLRTGVRKVLYRKSTGRPEPPTREDLERLIDAFETDLERLRALAGPGFPAWSAEALRKKHLTPAPLDKHD